MAESSDTGRNILLVEDELPMRKFLRNFLTGSGYQVVEAATADEALTAAAENPPDLLILDLGLPDLDGQDVLVQLREWLHAPVIVLSARDQDAQKVAALDAGADDYLTKPFSTTELLARVRVALRHAERARMGEQLPVFKSGYLKIDLTARQVFLRDKEIHLTPIEYRLLAALARHAGKVVPHQCLLKEIWGDDADRDTQHLRVFMGSLRRKVEVNLAQPRYVRTERGIGYRLAADDSPL